MHTRHRKILDMLQKGKVEIKAAAQQLGVTEMTVRRDLRTLEKQELVLQVKGGAILAPARYEPEQHDDELMDLKFAIAEALYMQIMPCNAIFLSTGSTSLAFAKTLIRKKNFFIDGNNKFFADSLGTFPLKVQSHPARRRVTLKFT